MVQIRTRMGANRCFDGVVFERRTRSWMSTSLPPSTRRHGRLVITITISPLLSSPPTQLLLLSTTHSLYYHYYKPVLQLTQTNSSYSPPHLLPSAPSTHLPHDHMSHMAPAASDTSTDSSRREIHDIFDVDDEERTTARRVGALSSVSCLLTSSVARRVPSLVFRSWKRRRAETGLWQRGWRVLDRRWV
ncbi:hypothetical protein SCHPADRAFT_569116 [Schizopora paradoxa]|uniref:Uncharacterized protein n=1 Tax=Schizopora paradoxa TaxID=27342 RepID=A0A0H2RC11_9AGAM|nr:hypothetical protein SCHPADRAFT_569116 [Schizopora paradoxa]